MQPKRGRYERADEGQYGSAAPSEYDDRDQDTFAVPSGQAPRAAKKAAPLGAPGVATGSVTSRDGDNRCRSMSRSGSEYEEEPMDVDRPTGNRTPRKHQS